MLTSAFHRLLCFLSSRTAKRLNPRSQWQVSPLSRARRARLEVEPLEERAVASVTALNDQFAVQPGVSATLDVLSNDSNPDGTGLQVIAHTAITPAGPTLADNGDGTFTFTSAAPGTFTFDYTVGGRARTDQP